MTSKRRTTPRRFGYDSRVTRTHLRLLDSTLAPTNVNPLRNLLDTGTTPRAREHGATVRAGQLLSGREPLKHPCDI